MSEEASSKDPGRRGVLSALLALGGTTIAAILAVPGLRFLADPLLRRRSGATTWTKVATIDSLPDDVPVAVPVVGERVDAWTRAKAQRLGTVWLRKKSDRRVDALQAECPHLGCSVQLDAERHRFACPCHESFFNLEGHQTSGPSPRDMDSLEARVTADGDVEVHFARYRTQSHDKVKLG
jgi:cytochrome b6-f complex iron-sulfur subunit/menaquinol-cytochrome c reductase iron-sulfur subunit